MFMFGELEITLGRFIISLIPKSRNGHLDAFGLKNAVEIVVQVVTHAWFERWFE